jgi:hypothetical protein
LSRPPWLPRLPPAPNRRHYLCALNPPTSATRWSTSAIHVHAHCAQAQLAALSTMRTPATTPPDTLMVVVDLSLTPLTSPPLKRREEGARGSCRGHPTSEVATQTMPPALQLCHPPPCTSPLAPDAKNPVATREEQGGEATWASEVPPAPCHPHALSPCRRPTASHLSC